MSRIAVVASIRYGMYAEVCRLVRPNPTPQGPQVFLTGTEAVFVFEGADAHTAAEELLGETSVTSAAVALRRCLAGRPRFATDVSTSP